MAGVAWKPSLRISRGSHSAEHPGCVQFLNSACFEKAVGVSILVNFCLTMWETDTRSRQRSGVDTFDDLRTAQTLNFVFLTFYTAECAARLFASRLEFFSLGWNLFDLATVCLSFLAELFSISAVTGGAGALAPAGSPSSMAAWVASLSTLVRLLRLARLCIAFDGLYLAASTCATCVRALLWALTLLLMVVAVLSVIAVEYIYPSVFDLSSAPDSAGAVGGVRQAMLAMFGVAGSASPANIAWAADQSLPAWFFFVFVALVIAFGAAQLLFAVVMSSVLDARAQTKRKHVDAYRAWALQFDQDGGTATGELQASMEALRRSLDVDPCLKVGLSLVGQEEADYAQLFEAVTRTQTQVEQHRRLLQALLTGNQMAMGEVASGALASDKICALGRPLAHHAIPSAWSKHEKRSTNAVVEATLPTAGLPWNEKHVYFEELVETKVVDELKSEDSGGSALQALPLSAAPPCSPLSTSAPKVAHTMHCSMKAPEPTASTNLRHAADEASETAAAMMDEGRPPLPDVDSPFPSLPASPRETPWAGPGAAQNSGETTASITCLADKQPKMDDQEEASFGAVQQNRVFRKTVERPAGKEFDNFLSILKSNDPYGQDLDNLGRGTSKGSVGAGGVGFGTLAGTTPAASASYTGMASDGDCSPISEAARGKSFEWKSLM